MEQQLRPILNELNTLRKETGFIKSFREEQEYKRIQEEDQGLEDSIQTVIKGHPEIDFNEIDSSGLSLLDRMIKFGTDKGINDFQVINKAYNHDRIVKLHEMKAIEKLTKEQQRKSRLGLLGESLTPFNKPEKPVLKSQSYDDLAREAMELLQT